MNSQIDFGPSLPESAKSLMRCPTLAWGGMSPANWCAAEPPRRPITTKPALGRAGPTLRTNIALKELVETRRWLKFIALAGLLPVSRIEGLVDECDQLCRILGKSVSTAKSKPRPGILTNDQ